jgi:hypothetical protein
VRIWFCLQTLFSSQCVLSARFCRTINMRQIKSYSYIRHI